MFKYNPGDLLGENKIKLLYRTKKDKNNIWFGIFQCPFCSNTFETRISDVVKNHTRSCGCLAKQTKSNNGKRNLKNLLGQSYGKLTVIELTNERNERHAVWKCLCECGNFCFIDSGDWGHIYSCGCILSKGEAIIQKILQENNISFEKQKTFEDLKINDNYLRFDFYLPIENCIIEYDGIQHYQYSSSGWDTEKKFLLTQTRDKIKNQWCLNKKIPLIRIPYTDLNKIDYFYLKKRIEGEC